MPEGRSEPRNDPRPEPRWGQYSDASPPLPTPQVVGEAAAPNAAPPAPPRRIGDIFLTVLLLGVGLIDVLMRYSQFENFAAIFHESYAQLGYGDFTSDAAANAMGAFQNIARIVILAIAVILSVRLITRGKRAFWVPLAAGVAAAILMTIGFFIVMLGDPALAQYAQTL
ncbi:MAG: DUF6264 family protein [Rhodoglobus sp.]|nr:DUF6264 family protein [Rhodoglobus sp.]